MSKSVSEISFEEALQNLEKVVRALEVGEAPLDQAIDLFQQGISLVKLCSNKLDEAEKKIQVLVQGDDGEPKLKTAVTLEEGTA